MKKLLAIISAIITGGLAVIMSEAPSVLARMCDIESLCRPAFSQN